ncbi:MAG: antibiotic biosynthesis monooxygenase [Neisseria sp.]|nr:antibiotic biosynthesis monooxygenase [Neisseria sp.]
MNFIKKAVLTAAFAALSATAFAQDFVHTVKLTIDPTQLDRFQTALAAEIKEAVRTEPDFLAAFASQDKANPNQIYLFEIFKSADAMNAYHAKPRFQAFLKQAMPMLQAREAVELTPIVFQTQTDFLQKMDK